MATEGERSSRIQMPWSAKGWASDEHVRRTSGGVYDVIDIGGRWTSPVLTKNYRPGYAISSALNNPWPTILIAPLCGFAGIVMFTQLAEVPWLAIIVLSFFHAAALALIVLPALRVPNWHRARRLARDFVRQHGGPFPPELRWFT